MHASELYDRFCKLAISIRATEMAVFAVHQSPNGTEMKALGHLRPDASTADTRAEALAAFQDIMRPCLAQKKDGAIAICDPDPAGTCQYCLVTLIRHRDEIIGAAAYIVRCKDERGAIAALSLVKPSGEDEWLPLFRLAL